MNPRALVDPASCITLLSNHTAGAHAMAACTCTSASATSSANSGSAAKHLRSIATVATMTAQSSPTMAASLCRNALGDKRSRSAVQLSEPITSVAPLCAVAASSERHSVR